MLTIKQQMSYYVNENFDLSRGYLFFMTQNESLSPSQKDSFQEKLSLLQKKFSKFTTEEEKYHFLIQLGREVPSMDPVYKTQENLVKGCQSQLFIHAKQIDGKFFFTTDSDALISKGLAAILIYAYNGETATTIITHPPTFLEGLGILSSLSPNRAQGAIHIYLKMRTAVSRIMNG
jgi:cysteine desulfuration protein SufE